MKESVAHALYTGLVLNLLLNIILNSIPSIVVCQETNFFCSSGFLNIECKICFNLETEMDQKHVQTRLVEVVPETEYKQNEAFIPRPDPQLTRNTVIFCVYIALAARRYNFDLGTISNGCHVPIHL